MGFKLRTVLREPVITPVVGKLDWLVYTSPDTLICSLYFYWNEKHQGEWHSCSSGAARMIHPQFRFHFLLPLAFRQLSVGSDEISNPLVFPFWEMRHFFKTRQKCSHLSPEAVFLSSFLAYTLVSSDPSSQDEQPCFKPCPAVGTITAAVLS